MNNKFSLDFFRLDGKVAIVTGGNTGIGMAYAEALASAGADLLITTFDNNVEDVKSTVEGLGRRVVFVQGDLTKADFRDEVISTCIKGFSSIFHIKFRFRYFTEYICLKTEKHPPVSRRVPNLSV